MRRLYTTGTLADYARAESVTVNTARRRARAGKIPGAVHSGGRWHVPLTTRQYATAHGMSLRTAQREAEVSAPSPTSLEVQSVLPSGLEGNGLLREPLVYSAVLGREGVYEYEWQFWVIIAFNTDPDKLYKINTPLFPSHKRQTKQWARTQIHDWLALKFASSAYEIKKMGVVHAYKATQ